MASRPAAATLAPPGVWPRARDALALLKPLTWFPPMWAFACGIASAGVAMGQAWPVLLAGLVLTGPVVCGASQALNDWFDREVDALNEPNRPIPSGRVTGRQVAALVGALVLVALAISAALGPLVVAATLAAFALAVAYSVPPLRLKASGWWGPLACGLAYETLAWFTGAAALAGGWPGHQTALLALLYGLGAHGIMTTNDFKAVEGDRAMGVRSLPVLLGPQRAALVACLVMALAQLVVVALLALWGHGVSAAIVAALLVGQLFAMRRLLAAPRERAPWFNGPGTGLFVLGMMAAALGVGGWI